MSFSTTVYIKFGDPVTTDMCRAAVRAANPSVRPAVSLPGGHMRLLTAGPRGDEAIEDALAAFAGEVAKVGRTTYQVLEPVADRQQPSAAQAEQQVPGVSDVSTGRAPWARTPVQVGLPRAGGIAP